MEGVGIGVTDEGASSNFNGGEVDFNGVENLEEYRPGGYHPVTPGDVLGGRLVILQNKFFFSSGLFGKNQSKILFFCHLSLVTCSILIKIETNSWF